MIDGSAGGKIDAESYSGNQLQRSDFLALSVTAVWFLVELPAGFCSNSLALLADAAHMMTDLAALPLSLFALKISTLPPTNPKTFAYVRVEILAALANGVILVIVGLGIAYEAYQRMFQPPEVKSATVIVVVLLICKKSRTSTVRRIFDGCPRLLAPRNSA